MLNEGRDSKDRVELVNDVFGDPALTLDVKSVAGDLVLAHASHCEVDRVDTDVVFIVSLPLNQLANAAIVEDKCVNWSNLVCVISAHIACHRIYHPVWNHVRAQWLSHVVNLIYESWLSDHHVPTR